MTQGPPEHSAVSAGAAKPNPWLPGWAARLVAWRRHALGHYDARTAGYYRHAWNRRNGLASLVEWLRFRRELGQSLGPELAQVLRGVLGNTRGTAAWQAVELLLEADALANDAGDKALVWLEPHAERSPPIAHYLLGFGVALTPRAARLAELHEHQTRWRQVFGDHLSACQGSICVVGNAGSLNGSGLGAAIDDHRLVVRFNRWASASAAQEDIGSRLDVWVCAPRFLPEVFSLERGLAPWMVVTGPDARYHRAGRAVDWDVVLKMLDAGVKVLTIPRPIWRDPVAQLGAPPSAGVLFLAWSRRFVTGFDRLDIAGFDIAGAGTKGYHHAGPRFRPARRHDWASEATLLEGWKNEGLGCVT